MKREQDGSDVTRVGSFGKSTSKRVLDMLEASCLRLGKVVMQRITVVKVRVNNRGGHGKDCFVVKVNQIKSNVDLYSALSKNL